jgi:hypothetical protein
MTAMVDSEVGSGGDDLGPDEGWWPEASSSVDEASPFDGAVFPEELPGWMLRAMDPASAPGQWTEAGLVAAFRAHNQAAWSRAVWTLHACRATAGTTKRVSDRRRAGKIAAAALGWSEGFGAGRLEFARQILERLPALGQAMREGWLEEAKAEIFVSVVADLDDAQARLVIERLLGRAPGWTFAQLRTQVEATAKAVDPAWAEARKNAALARARVLARTAPSGAAELSGLDLPHELADLAHDRIVALAVAVTDRLRGHGCEVGKGQVESRVMLRVLGPEAVGFDDEAIIELVTVEFLTTGSGRDRGPDDGGPDDRGPDDSGPDGPGDGGPEDGGPDEPDPDGRGPSDDGGHGGPDGGGGEDDDSAGEPNGGDPDEGGGADARGADEPGQHGHTFEPGTSRWSSRPVTFKARVVVRLGLRTALGLDQRPGEVPDWGSVCSSTAYHLAWHRPGTAIRLLLYDPDGHLEYLLTLRPPDRRSIGTAGPHQRQSIELTAHTALLDALNPEQLADPAAAELLERAHRALAVERARPPGHHPAHSRADARRRRPGTALADWVRGRDQTCRAPACTRSALGADLDHTLAWEDGGHSVADDLGALCEADHLLKHDPHSGWTVVQPSAATFVWTTPTGARHVVTEDPYDELPDPQRPADGGFSLPAEAFTPPHQSQAEPFAPRRNRHGYITAAARATAEDLAERRRARRGEPPSRYDRDPDF